MTQAERTKKPTAIPVKTAGVGADKVVVLWAPGCTACLRMKEFVEKTGIPYEAVNVFMDPDGAEKLRRAGGKIPAIMVGERWTQGVNLAAVADLLGVEYTPPVILPAAELRQRYGIIIDCLCRLVAQADPYTLLEYRYPGRDRSMLNIAYHSASVMRVFLMVYDPDGYDGEPYSMTIESPIPDSVVDAEGVIARANDTLALFERWWERDGRDDPLDQIIDTTYWGHTTAIEALEREVWHTAQHTRHVAMFLEERGITPASPLGDAELAGLPVPERVFA